MEIVKWFDEDYEDVIRVTEIIPDVRLEWHLNAPVWLFDLGHGAINITRNMELFVRLQRNATGMGYEVELVVATLEQYIVPEEIDRWMALIEQGDEHWRYNRYLFARFEKH